MLLPGIVTLVPTYVIFRELGWVNTYLPLIVPTFLGTPFYIFLFRQFFLRIPESISEAAHVDGASELRIYATIIFPVSRPVIAAVAVLAFVQAWTDYLGPLIYLNKPSQWTLSLGLTEFLSKYSLQWNYMMAAAVVFTLPLIIVFFVFSKQFLRGSASIPMSDDGLKERRLMTDLRVMTYNMLHAPGDRLAPLVDVVKSVAPDVLACQEVNTFEGMMELAHALDMLPVWGVANSPEDCRDGQPVFEHLVIFTRLAPRRGPMFIRVTGAPCSVPCSRSYFGCRTAQRFACHGPLAGQGRPDRTVPQVPRAGVFAGSALGRRRPHYRHGGLQCAGPRRG